MQCVVVPKTRSIRFQDEDKVDAEEVETEEVKEEPPEVEAKPVTPLQAAMLRMAAEKIAKMKEDSQKAAENEEVSPANADRYDIHDTVL